MPCRGLKGRAIAGAAGYEVNSALIQTQPASGGELLRRLRRSAGKNALPRRRSLVGRGHHRCRHSRFRRPGAQHAYPRQIKRGSPALARHGRGPGEHDGVTLAVRERIKDQSSLTEGDPQCARFVLLPGRPAQGHRTRRCPRPWCTGSGGGPDRRRTGAPEE